MARALGLSETSANSTLNKWIRVDNYLSKERLVRLAWLLNVDVPYLLDQTDRSTMEDIQDSPPKWIESRTVVSATVDFAKKIGTATFAECQGIFVDDPDWEKTPLSFLTERQRRQFSYTFGIERMRRRGRRSPDPSDIPGTRGPVWCLTMKITQSENKGMPSEYEVVPVALFPHNIRSFLSQQKLASMGEAPVALQLLNQVAQTLPPKDLRDPWKVLEAQYAFLKSSTRKAPRL